MAVGYCHIHGWDKSNAKLFTTSNPKSYQVVSVGLRTGTGGGIYEGGQTIADANGNDMSRPMKARVVSSVLGWIGGEWLLSGNLSLGAVASLQMYPRCPTPPESAPSPVSSSSQKGASCCQEAPFSSLGCLIG
jgi:hypothetical protein